MEYRVLGKLEALRDDEIVDLGAFRQRALLALLLTSPNSVFSTDQLIDGLWGDDGSPDRQNSLWVYISGLRKALEPEREKRSDGTILLTRAPGYVLHADEDEVDAVLFERLVVEGKALAHTDPGAASVVLGEALSMWRGRPYEDFTYESFAQAEIARLDGLRLEAVEARIDADLDRGLSRELVSELETLVRQHPLQEHLTGQLMQALYRSGRQADALRSYQGLRARLAEEVGLEPGSAIQRLEAKMLSGDESLDRHPNHAHSSSGRPSAIAVRGYELRDEIRQDEWGVTYRAYQPAVGREVAISIIRPELANDPEFIRNFEADAQLVARLEHPHLVPLHDFWREPDAAYVVTRLMPGGSLAHTLEQRALTAEQATTVLQQVGGAVQLAQRSGVRLPALTANNIVLDDEGNAYVSNVGLASLDAAADRTQGEIVAELGLVMAQAISGLSGEMVQVRGALAPSVRDVLDRATTFGDAPGYADVDGFAEEMGDIVGLASSPPQIDEEELVNPYKGLRSFEASDEKRFFGRERLIERLVARLGEQGSRGRFVTLVGPSGSGKSSVVKAGLLPALRSGALPLSDSWFTVSMTPAPHPFEELEDALRTIAVDPPSSIVDLLSGENGLHRSVERVLPTDASQLLLVIDQFEELFTQVDQRTATQFLDVLAAAVNHDRSRLRVVITLRADFYDCPLRHRGIGELLRDGTEAITPMTPEELERAIAGPAELVGVSVEPTAMAELVTDVVDRPGALPLMQYALTELFDGRRGLRMTTETYREIGGMSGALVDRADGLLARLGEPASDATRQIFLRLVTLGEGSDDTRRRVLRSELEQLSVEREILEGVLDTFGRHRLLSFDRDPVTRGPTVEISHEALLTEWDRLRDWIDGARHDVRNQRRLAEAMAEWAGAGKSDEYLLRGGRLDQLGGWATTTSLPLSLHEQSFLDASVAERDRVEQEERLRDQRAIDAENQARSRARQLSVAGAAGALVAVFAVLALVQWRSAESAKSDVDRLLTVSDLVAASDAALESDPQLALLLATQAVRETVELGFATEEGVDAVHWSLQQLGVQYDVDRDTPVAVRSGPAGLTGVYVIPPAELVAFAESSIDRTLTESECERFLAAPCPDRESLSDDLLLRAGEDSYGASSGPGALAGTSVTMLAAWERAASLEAELAAFAEVSGITIEYVGNNVNAEIERLATEAFEFPDVAAFPQPAAIGAFTRDQRLMDLGEYLDIETLKRDFGEYLLTLGTVGGDGAWPSDTGTLAGLPIDVDLKGLVYYPKSAFEAAGYAVPTTFDELIELSEQIVADGHEPWCIGFGSGPASGWPGTDLIESLAIRVGGTELYDEWTIGQTPFQSPAIQDAGRLADTLVHTPGFVRSGPEAIGNSFFQDQLLFMLQRDRSTDEVDPQCWLSHGGDFLLAEGPVGTKIGEDLDFFLLPPVDPNRPTPATGGGNFAAAFSDRPEVRAFVEFLSSPEWGERWAADPESANFMSPNSRFDVSSYGALADEETAAVRQALGSEVRSALEDGVWRFDASDLMPGPIGSFGETGPGAFWTGMLDWVDGVQTIDQVFANIDETWEEIRAEGGT